MFYALTCLIKPNIPFASAWAENDIFSTFIFTSYNFLSIYNDFTPDNNLFPKVPATQNPGIIIVFLAFPHHYLKTCIEVPPWSIPGVAKST